MSKRKGTSKAGGLINFHDPAALVTGIILLVVAVQILAQVLPDLIDAFINISGISGLGFASFFASGGVVLLLLGVGVLLAVFKMLGIGKHSR